MALTDIFRRKRNPSAVEELLGADQVQTDIAAVPDPSQAAQQTQVAQDTGQQAFDQSQEQVDLQTEQQAPPPPPPDLTQQAAAQTTQATAAGRQVDITQDQGGGTQTTETFAPPDPWDFGDLPDPLSGIFEQQRAGTTTVESYDVSTWYTDAPPPTFSGMPYIDWPTIRASMKTEVWEGLDGSVAVPYNTWSDIRRISSNFTQDPELMQEAQAAIEKVRLFHAPPWLPGPLKQQWNDLSKQLADHLSWATAADATLPYSEKLSRVRGIEAFAQGIADKQRMIMRTIGAGQGQNIPPLSDDQISQIRDAWSAITSADPGQTANNQLFESSLRNIIDAFAEGRLPNNTDVATLSGLLSAAVGGGGEDTTGGDTEDTTGGGKQRAGDMGSGGAGGIGGNILLPDVDPVTGERKTLDITGGDAGDTGDTGDTGGEDEDTFEPPDLTDVYNLISEALSSSGSISDEERTQIINAVDDETMQIEEVLAGKGLIGSTQHIDEVVKSARRKNDLIANEIRRSRELKFNQAMDAAKVLLEAHGLELTAFFQDQAQNMEALRIAQERFLTIREQDIQERLGISKLELQNAIFLGQMSQERMRDLFTRYVALADLELREDEIAAAIEQASSQGDSGWATFVSSIGMLAMAFA